MLDIIPGATAIIDINKSNIIATGGVTMLGNIYKTTPINMQPVIARVIVYRLLSIFLIPKLRLVGTLN